MKKVDIMTIPGRMYRGGTTSASHLTAKPPKQPNRTQGPQVPDTEVWTITHLRGVFPTPPSPPRSQCLRDGTFGVVAGREDSPDKRFPAGKQAAGQGSRGVRCLGLQSIQSQGEPIKARSTGRTRLKHFVCGEEQPRERGRRQSQDHARQPRHRGKGTS